MEALVLCVDVGRYMSDYDYGQQSSHMELARNFVSQALLRKIFNESKDYIALVLFGSADTDNNINKESPNKCCNIKVIRELEPLDWNLIRLIELNNILSETETSAGWLDAVDVAMDLLEAGVEGKKFKGRSIYLISAFSQELLNAVRHSQSVTKSMKDNAVTLTIIGPEFLRNDAGLNENVDGPSTAPPEDLNGSLPSTSSSKQREKLVNSDACATILQHKARSLLKEILDTIEGEHMSFREALPYVARLQTRAVRPTAWKVNLEIGRELQIPVCGYKKTSPTVPKQTWKQVCNDDPSVAIQQQTSYFADADRTVPVEKEDVVAAYKYGKEKILLDRTDIDQYTKYKTGQKALQLLGCAPSSSVKRWYLTGDGVYYLVGDKQDPDAAVALNAFIQALQDEDMVGIARYSYHAGCAPKIVGLFSKLRRHQCLVMVQLPFADDLRSLEFPSLTSSKKYAPSQEQLSVIDELITTLDLSQVESVDGDTTSEAVNPKKISNPQTQRLFQCLHARALYPGKPLPELNSDLLKQFEAPAQLQDLAWPVFEKIKELFRLEPQVETKKRKHQESTQESDEFSGDAKHAKLGEDMDLANEGYQAVNGLIHTVGTVDPFGDFKSLLKRNPNDCERFVEQLLDVVTALVFDRIGSQYHNKALRVLQNFREYCVTTYQPQFFNEYLAKLKGRCRMGKTTGNEFWTKICQEGVRLISRDESASSSIDEKEAEKFSLGDEPDKSMDDVIVCPSVDDALLEELD